MIVCNYWADNDNIFNKNGILWAFLLLEMFAGILFNKNSGLSFCEFGHTIWKIIKLVHMKNRDNPEFLFCDL